MKFTLLAIGKIKEKWMRQGIEEYVKRLKPIAPLEIIAQDEEKMPENPSPAMKERVMEKEGEKMLKYLSDDDCLVLLDLRWGSHVLGRIGRLDLTAYGHRDEPFLLHDRRSLWEWEEHPASGGSQDLYQCHDFYAPDGTPDPLRAALSRDEDHTA